MKIEVTEKHIKEGKRKDCGMCPVALAMLEQVPQAVECFVYGNSCRVYNKNYVPIIDTMLPGSAQVFIADFDEGDTVKPFTFELNI